MAKETATPDKEKLSQLRKLARDHRKELSRLKESCNAAKAKNRKLTKEIKIVKLRFKEVAESRDAWKIDCQSEKFQREKLGNSYVELEAALDVSAEELETLRKQLASEKKIRGS